MLLARIFLTLLLSVPAFMIGITQNCPLTNLISDSTPINYVTREPAPLLETSDKAFLGYPQQLIKNGNSTFVFINGTGRLYKAVQLSNAVNFQRQDTTTHFGYNIAAFPFCFQNRIFNIGGYGLWRMNGQLRVFNEKDRQWDIVKLNEEIPFLFDETNSLLWYDADGGKIYLGYATYRNEAVGSRDVDETKLDFVSRVLDLSKLQWQVLGSLNKTLSDKIQVIITIGMSPWGQLILVGDKLNLIDFKQNRILLLKVNTASYQSIFRNRQSNTFYFKDSTLFYGSNTAHTLDSIKMQYADFEFTGKSVFSPIMEKAGLSGYWGWLFTVLAAILVSGWVLKRYSFSIRDKKDLNNPNVNPFTNGNSLTGKVIFEEREIQILNMLINNSEKGQFTSIEEINKILGVTKRSLEIQKKQRSDTILSINKKYAFVHSDEEAPIQKQRTDLDKRSFEYYIDYSRLEAIKAFVSSVS